MNPLNLFALNTQFASLLFDTQAVMTLRILGMAGLLPHASGENSRMVKEKGPAMAQAYKSATKAAMAGGSPDQIMTAAMEPVSKKVRANRKRLTK
ncbi:antifreeze protein [Sulfitobacter sp. CW3]|jgi:hypothetical protein|uniref:antifreeze protein n=1 Tax=unclassified Sulfitobacter TaxID=196795 RepID=UPI0019F52343|nr:antifreeze protein [Sulfitobacter sp. CW3]MBW4961320.1 antifreeze protein [Sulfitobacter sp. CW3]NOR32765.1 antifreeze protein [Sulfitobacter sp.]|tara:strand:- start:16840 stop:17124 length:285 start_codon:yes stop_codon:yes gene_type:complete